MTRIPTHSIEDASYFLNYAGTERDIPAGAPGLGPAGAGPPAATSGAGS
jgi:hypothetical protein